MRNPPEKRRRWPRIGDGVTLLGGGEDVIASFALAQPGAPRMFKVDLKSGRALHVMAQGPCWVEFQSAIKNLSSGGERVGIPRPSGGPAGETESLAAAVETPQTSTVDTASTRAVPAQSSSPSPFEFGSLKPRAYPVQPEAAVFITPLRHAELRKRLDRAREAFSRVREHPDSVSADEYMRLQDAYCGLVAELDRKDPTFYGPVNRDEPLRFGHAENMPMRVRNRHPLESIAAWRRGLTGEEIERKLAYSRERFRKLREAKMAAAMNGAEPRESEAA